MKIFDVPEAQYYCGRFHRAGGGATGSLTKYVTATFKPGRYLRENTPDFDNYRDCALREAERFLFLGISNYRRGLDLMMPGAANWAHVTLYYSSYFAARALMGMFGGWIGTKVVVEVTTSQPGGQELVVTRPQTNYNPPHEKFWDLFYGAVESLVPWVDGKLRFAIDPIGGNVTWQTQNRNEINYDSFAACQLASLFQATFKPTRFPASLPGVLSTQFSVAEGLLLIVCRFVRQFGLATDALDALLPAGARSGKINRLVFRDRPARVVQMTRARSFLV